MKTLVTWLALGLSISAYAQPMPFTAAPSLAAPPMTPAASPTAPPATPATPPALSYISVAGGYLLSLPKQLNKLQVRELISDILLRYELEQGYHAPKVDVARDLPALPEKATLGGLIVKTEGNATQVLRVAYFLHPRQSTQLLIYSATIGGASTSNPAGDPTAFMSIVQRVLAERLSVLGELPLSELESRTIPLSYIDADGALYALRAMGFSAITEDSPAGDGSKTEPAAPPPAASPFSFAPTMPMAPAVTPETNKYSTKNFPKKINYDNLPLIFKMPIPDDKYVGLVGADGTPTNTRDQLGLTVMPGAAGRLAGSTIVSSTTQLLVLFHPNDAEKFVRVKKVIEDIIDKPARQVFIEGMVLEVSKNGLDQLGVQWQRNKGPNSWSIGSINGVGNTLTLGRATKTLEQATSILSQISALVNEGKAEILSRPSVLTLDNRQATIRVGVDIPIATSKDAGNSSTSDSRVSFTFQYIPTGILLNVRPRIDSENKEVAMLIDTTVSATVPGADLEVRDKAGTLLASAPSISTRRVQTYARIANNTPLIIGGLVSRDQTKDEDRVPLLGELPVLGNLFKYHKDRDDRREVIIVLTPSILPEDPRVPKAQLPKDDSVFDSTGTDLFRDSYRIRSEDLFDTQYLRFNQRLLTLRNMVNTVIRVNPDLNKNRVLAKFQGDRVPGEQHLVVGMLYKLNERLNLGDNIPTDKLTFFANADGTQIDNIDTLLGVDFFNRNPGKALALTFSYGRNQLDPGKLLLEPTPQISLVDCPDRKTWAKLLWTMSQPGPDGLMRYTVLLQNASDVERLKHAVAIKRLIFANGGESALNFNTMLPGKLLSIQEIKPGWQHLLDGRVAELFFLTEHHYPAFTRELETSLQELEATLRKPEMAPYLEGQTLPAWLRAQLPANSEAAK